MPDAILISYGWQPGRTHMESINQRLGGLNPTAPHRWQFTDISDEGDAYGGFKVGPELWAGAFRQFPWEQFAEWMRAEDWEDRESVQVMAMNADDGPWVVYGLNELGRDVAAEPNDVAGFVAYVQEKCRGARDDMTICIDLRTARAIADRLDAHGGTLRA
jgi:hypothetical protein